MNSALCAYQLAFRNGERMIATESISAASVDVAIQVSRGILNQNLAPIGRLYRRSNAAREFITTVSERGNSLVDEDGDRTSIRAKSHQSSLKRMRSIFNLPSRVFSLFVADSTTAMRTGQ